MKNTGDPDRWHWTADDYARCDWIAAHYAKHLAKHARHGRKRPGRNMKQLVAFAAGALVGAYQFPDQVYREMRRLLRINNSGARR